MSCELLHTRESASALASELVLVLAAAQAEAPAFASAFAHKRASPKKSVTEKRRPALLSGAPAYCSFDFQLSSSAKPSCPAKPLDALSQHDRWREHYCKRI